MDPDAGADAIEAALRTAAIPERAAGAQAYLKGSLPHLGATVPATRRAAVGVARALDRREDVLALAEALWRRPLHECRLAAVEVLALHAQRLEPDDLVGMEPLLRDAGTWALVDPLAIHVVGRVVLGHPEAGAHLDRWIGASSHWVRRAALLALLGGVRAGAPDWARIDGFAEAQLDDREFFIRKAIGWLLREVARTDPDRVVAWLEPRVGRAAPLTIREAAKHLPADRDRLLALRRQRQLS